MSRFSDISNKVTSAIFGKSNAKKKSRKVDTVPASVQRLRQDAESRRLAIQEAEQVFFPFRVKMQRLYLNTAENGFVSACIDRRKDLTLLRKWEFKTKGGGTDEKLTSIFCNQIDGKTSLKQWFENFISFALDAKFYGYSLIYLGDVVNGEIVGTEVEKRWLVSPDRCMISRFEYMTTGVDFIVDPEVQDSYVWVSTPNDQGTSTCGFGEFFKISIYEIILRNILRLNADYLEVNIAPFRQVKTSKTEETERAELYEAAVNMGSNGVALTDENDEIIFHSSSGSGTTYNAFDQAEERIEAKISQLILGHADAMKSIPGKLGNEGEESPAQKALEDKQSKDGDFITALVNNVLIPKLRRLGFPVPDGATAVMINDNESMEIAEDLVDLGGKMKTAGLQMDAKYFTEKTGIPTVDVAPAIPKLPAKGFSDNIQNKLKAIYG